MRSVPESAGKQSHKRSGERCGERLMQLMTSFPPCYTQALHRREKIASGVGPFTLLDVLQGHSDKSTTGSGEYKQLLASCAPARWSVGGRGKMENRG